ncbi:NADH-ubiquinone dehydrogenase [Nitratireductor alexandrii]|uniref:NADH-ubiquinone dehydrogenase n=1 Tax=Nitratireductor alexandrii TaxID=2448161 RepID=UPI001EE7A249|nr:NADH-ubiquinone dehydrogenase [Nitratireductor alexandrii]
MSPYFMPHALLPDVKEVKAGLEKMSQDFSELMPKEFRGAVNLAAHPLAAGAAMTAIGIGVAGQAFGLWMGAVAGSMEAARRMSEHGLAGDDGSAGEPAYKAPASPRARMRAAVETLAADVEHVARDLAETSGKVARAIADDTARVSAAKARYEDAAAPAADTAADDLKAISGVGPKLEQVLNRRGIRSYAQVAALTDDEIARLDEALGFKGRIERDDWRGQAKKLSAGNGN